MSNAGFPYRMKKVSKKGDGSEIAADFAGFSVAVRARFPHRPFLSDKYDITKHPNYYLTADADDRNTFDMEIFLNRKLKLRSNEEYTIVQA